MQANKNLPHNHSPGNEPIITAQRAAEIIGSWHIDPISKWAAEQRTRQFTIPSPTYFSTDHALAKKVEVCVKARLEALGHVVTQTSHKAKYDLLVDNCLKVEVKGSNWHTQGARGRFQANIRNHAADVLMFVAHNGADHHFIIPVSELRKSLTIRSYDLTAYTGKWSKYREAWHVLFSALAEARQDRINYPWRCNDA